METHDFKYECNLGIKDCGPLYGPSCIRILIIVRANGVVSFCGKIYLGSNLNTASGKPAVFGQLTNDLKKVLKAPHELRLLDFWENHHLKPINQEQKKVLYALMKEIDGNDSKN